MSLPAPDITANYIVDIRGGWALLTSGGQWWSQSYRDVHEAVAKPLNDQRLVRVGNGLVTDVFPGTVVDLHVRLLDDAEQNNDSTAGSHTAARQTHALEIHSFPRTGRQQATTLETIDGAHSRPVCGQQYVLLLCGELVERDVDVEILLVGD